MGLVLVLAWPGKADALSRDELLSRIAAARGLAAEGVSDPSPGRMDAVRRTLGLPDSLDLDEGRRVTIEADPYLAGIRGEIGDEFRRAGAHLETLEAGVRSTGTGSFGDQRIASALARAYAGVRTRESLWERLRGLVARLIAALQEWIARHVAGSPSRAVAWLIVGGVLVGIVILLRRLRIVPNRSVAPVTDDVREEQDWRRLAEQAETSGDLGAALKARYRLLLAVLAARGILRDAPSLTATECRASVRTKLPRAYPPVADATDAFERVFYAQVAPRAEDLRTMRTAEEAARAA
ncbi:MAG: DUF4129 domain-containing protein [Actinomycetota bacterium]